MPKTLKVISIVIFFISLFPLAFSQAQTTDSIRFVTYYPSPYGSYAELRSKKLAVGAGYINAGRLIWNTDHPTTCMPDEICNADLVVEGNVGIGTTGPGKKLHVFTTVNGDGICIESSGLSTAGVAFARDGIEYASIGAVAKPGDGSQDSLLDDLVIRSGGSNSNPGTKGGRILFATNNLEDNAFPAKVTITNGGNVGIGTTSPFNQLTVNSDNYQGNIGISGASDSGLTYSSLSFHDNTADANNAWVIGHRKMTGDVQEDDLQIVRFINPPTTGLGRLDLTIDSGTGNVGIGTTNPGAKLDVAGTIKSSTKSQSYTVQFNNPSFSPIVTDTGCNETRLSNPLTAENAHVFLNCNSACSRYCNSVLNYSGGVFTEWSGPDDSIQCVCIP